MSPDSATDSLVYAGFRLIGPLLIPEEVSRRLRITPTKTQQLQVSPARRPGWFLSTEGVVDSLLLRDHLRLLLDNLEPVAVELSSIYEDFSVRPSVFCFARNPGGASVSLEAADIKRLSALELDYQIDLYSNDPTTSGYVHIAKHRERHIDVLNGSLRRAGMYYEGTAMKAISDLAHIDLKERQLAQAGEKLALAGWWSKTGFAGALQCVFGSDIPAAKSIELSPIVALARKFGWIELDDFLSVDNYWQAVNTSPHWLKAEQRTVEDLTARLGPPSIIIGNVKGLHDYPASRGYTTERSSDPFLWFDTVGPNVVSCRRSSDSLRTEFLFGRPDTFDEAKASAFIERRHDMPKPFRLPAKDDQ